MSINKTGFFCNNFHYLASKVKRIAQTLKKFEKNNNKVFLEAEIKIFFEDLGTLPKIIQESVEKMEKGLSLRKEFLESKNLEEEYQKFKKTKS